MSKSKIIRRDVSNDPEAHSKAISHPEFQAALLDCGFTNVGFCEVSAPGLLTQKQLEETIAPTDAALIFNALENGEVIEVLGSSDKSTFAYIDIHFGGHVLIFITIAQDGTIVDTTMKPLRAPHASEKLTGAAKTTFFNFVSQIAAKLRKLLLGLPPLWPRSNRPKAGYYLELLETRNPKVIWLRHQARLGEILKPNQEIPPHDKLDLYLCTIKRNGQIMEYNGKCSLALYVVAGILSIFIAALLFWEEYLILGLFLHPIADTNTWFLLNSPVLLLLYVGFVLIGQNILPELPGPRLENVPTLMKKIL